MKHPRQKKNQRQGLSKQKKATESSKQQRHEPKTPKQVEQSAPLADKFQEEVNAKIGALSEKLLVQDKQQEETNIKIGALANAVGSLNEEFTKFIETLKAQATNPSQANPHNGNTRPVLGETSGTEPPSPEPEPSKQDKFLAWAQIIAKLSEAGGGGGGGVPADANAMPGSLMQLVNSLKVMGELRKTFLGELKEMIGFAKGIQTTVQNPKIQPQGTAHLSEE